MASASETTAPIIVVLGATGTGKSELALNIAEQLETGGAPAEIVNADAMQLYRGMDIGTAKLSIDQRRGIPHHMLDVLEVSDEASVAWYQPRARQAISDIQARSATPILVGGSGLYISSVIYEFQFPPRDPAVRARLEEELAAVGSHALHARLRDAAPETATRIDPANGRRVVRALEVLELSNSGHGGALPAEPELWRSTRLIGLRVPRAELVERLESRVESMWRSGLVDEVSALLSHGIEHGVTASRAIGYAQALAQLRGEMTQADAIAQTKQLTRRYARRQVSWFSRYSGVTWLDSPAAYVTAFPVPGR